MRILICGGKSKADFVISAFQKKANRLVVISDDPAIAEDLSKKHGIDVQISDPTKIYSFEDAKIADFDLVISLLDRDVDNFVVCRICKEIFKVRKAICTVNNPNKVEAFRLMGIDSPLSASYLLSERIMGESDVYSLINTLSLENNKVTITEIKIKATFPCVGKSLKDLGMPKQGNICCIFRDPEVVIPFGETVIKAGDTLIIASSPADQQGIVEFLRG